MVERPQNYIRRLNSLRKKINERAKNDVFVGASIYFLMVISSSFLWVYIFTSQPVADILSDSGYWITISFLAILSAILYVAVSRSTG